MNKFRQIFSLANIGPWLMVPVVLLAFFFGRLVSGGHDHQDHAAAEGTAAAPQSWTCSMHPQIILPSNDQQCPICFMDLIPLDNSSQEGLDPGDLALSEAGIALAGIETRAVSRRFVAHNIPLVGKVVYDETNLHHITARYAGRLDKLYVSSKGERVKRGSHLADIYSPELYGAQVELLAAARTPGGENMVRAARQRLLLLGFTGQEIDQLERAKKQNTHLTITAPASGVVVDQAAVEGMYVKTGSLLYSIADLSSLWITLEAFESDLPWLRTGQQVPFTVRSQPGHEFTAVIDFIEPVLDEKTKAVDVRLLVDNSEGKLMPGMLVSASVEVVLDAAGQPVESDVVSTAPLMVPVAAVLQAGPEAMVYVKKIGAEGVFTGRHVKLGPRAGDYYLILSGLVEGEEVVVRGSFKIDSALQILAKPSMMRLLPDQNGARESIVKQEVTTRLDASEKLNTNLAELLVLYINLQTDLAADDGAASRRAASELSASLARTEAMAPEMTVAENIVWSRHYNPMHSSLMKIAGTNAIDKQRLAFQPLSDNLWDLLVVFGNPTPSQVVRHVNCPMAMGGEGANWLQFEKQVANPYYGASMLRCGSEFESLALEDSP
jgi:membrane fusion protein, copper/silver efflux system